MISSNKSDSMQVSIKQLLPDDPDWQQLCGLLKAKVTLSAQVLVAWQMGLWLARVIVEQQLQERASMPIEWDACSVCATRLVEHWICQPPNLNLSRVGWVATTSWTMSSSLFRKSNYSL